MFELVFPYLLASLATVVTVLTAIWAYVYHRRRALEMDRLEQRLPEACRYEDLQDRIDDAQEELGALSDELIEAKQVVGAKAEANRWLDENKEELRRVEAEREQQERLRAELEELQRRHAQDFENSKELRKEVEAAEFRLERLQEAEKHYAERVEQLEASEARLKEEVPSLRAEKESLQNELETLRARIDECRSEVNELKSEVQRLKEERKQSQSQWQEAVKREVEIEGRLPELEKLLATKKGELKALAPSADEERLMDLWQPVLPDKSGSKGMPSDEQQCLEQVEAYIEETGYRFARRQIYALHTGLKTADISPLTVLAGISGTGKSALPRHYANGMGMHFLNVAVQPRWDSPQDLFGFYNYLEHRFRATELARALVQMDYYADEDGRNWPASENWWNNGWCCYDMLLVLLDEMNLARVEYYFSEFLSRLEIRRDVDEQDPVQRRQAEIVLDVGTYGDTGSNLAVFPGRNVLFAGTMNEDETTQTLSDKVVDRANVLRFGRPRTLLETSAQGDGQVPRVRLPRETWQSWIRREDTLPPEYGERINSWLNQLNDALSGIHRPFGFRVQRAVRQYVANYPRYDEQGYNWAMADQIEQKILPKFRGLIPGDSEVGEALNKVTAILQELGDETLLRAVREAARRTEEPILFAGVDRLAEEEER